jgi:hypothetical protein
MVDIPEIKGEVLLEGIYATDSGCLLVLSDGTELVVGTTGIFRLGSAVGKDWTELANELAMIPYVLKA